MTNSSMNLLADLLVQKSTHGLSPQEQAQLDQLQREHSVSETNLNHESERIEMTAAAADIALFDDAASQMPEHLRENILVDAGKFFEAKSDSESVTTNTQQVADISRQGSRGINGWMISTILSTAACVYLLLLPDTPITPAAATPSVAELQQEFLNSAPADLMTVSLVPGFDSNGKSLTNSKLVWSDDQQKGFMSFSNLKINDPKIEQYQLWIFESADQKHPIDGGVFDITDKDQIIPIDPKILVNGAAFFAVTVEKPGGVVVSDRTRIATADPDLASLVAKALAEEEANKKPATK